METTFVQALRGEAAVAGGEHAGAFLWDLANFYEYVDHELLWERARAKNFPLAILAVALNQARAKRYLGLGDVAVDARFPRRGLAAGDSFATYLVQIYTLDPLERWSLKHPAVPLSLLIDEFLGSTSAPEEHQVVGRLASAAADLHELVKQDLGCQVANHKSVVVASSDRLLRRLSAAFGRFTGQASRSGSNLGVDFAPGRQRAHKKGVSVLRKREDGLRRRLRRLGALRRQGFDMRKLYITGLQSYAYYGAEVVGVDHQQLKSAQSRYLSLVGSPARSRSASVALALAGDPLWRQALGPVLTWASIIWKSTTCAAFQSFISLPQLGTLAGQVVQQLPRTWGA